MGKPSSRPLYPSVYQYHLSSVMALPPPTLRLVLNMLLIMTFPILADKPGCSISFSTLRQITSASVTDGWFPEKCEEQDLPNLDKGSSSINQNDHKY